MELCRIKLLDVSLQNHDHRVIVDNIERQLIYLDVLDLAKRLKDPLFETVLSCKCRIGSVSLNTSQLGENSLTASM